MNKEDFINSISELNIDINEKKLEMLEKYYSLLAVVL